MPHIEVVLENNKTVFNFDSKITLTGSMKAVDLLNCLNEQYNLGLPVEMADIERLRLYRLDENGQQKTMLNDDAVILNDKK